MDKRNVGVPFSPLNASGVEGGVIIEYKKKHCLPPDKLVVILG
jgi:hypothetical protein